MSRSRRVNSPSPRPGPAHIMPTSAITNSALIPLVLALASVTNSTTLHAGGRLDELREQVHRERDERDERDEEPTFRLFATDDEREEDSFLGALLTPFAELVLLAPFALPAEALGDDMSTPGYFPLHPYAGDARAMIIAPPPDEPARRYSLRVRTEYIHDEANLHRVGSRVRFDSYLRLGLDASTHQWRESLGDGRDRLWTGDANVTYRFAQNEYLQLRAGLGANWIHDRGSTHFGANVTYQLDAYPARPWVLTARLDAGTLRRASTFRARTTGGVLLGPAELFLGYDYFKAGRFRSHGPVVGLGLSF